MPELPEVETTRQGIEPHIREHTIQDSIVRFRRLRWLIPNDFESRIKQQKVQNVSRRGKYLCLHLNTDTILIHLGMSGRLSIIANAKPVQRHDHVDILFSNHRILRYTDPRRFGAILLSPREVQHPLLAHLGVEPLSKDFSVDYLLARAKNRTMAIKPFLMNNHIVVGIGNIYATESLFLARIHPAMPARNLSRKQAQDLIATIKQVLSAAIEKGGTTLKDFLNSEGKPGYFVQQLKAYGRGGMPCVACNLPLQSYVLAQRATVFCSRCQELS